jgi:ABC-type amino acid transport substrate-binding protein
VWRSLVAAGLLAALLAAVAAAARDPWDPRTKIRPADQAGAVASVLRRADLGAAWAGGARKPISFKAPTCPAQQPNDGDLTLTGHAESVFSNGNGGMQIDSDVEVYASVKQAKARFVRFLQPKLATCLRYDLAKSFAGVKATILKPTRLKFPKVADRVAAFRLPVVYQGVTVDSDFLYFGQGRSQFYVNVIAPANMEGQLPGFELRVAKLLVKRAPV